MMAGALMTSLSLAIKMLTKSPASCQYVCHLGRSTPKMMLVSLNKILISYLLGKVEKKLEDLFCTGSVVVFVKFPVSQE